MTFRRSAAFVAAACVITGAGLLSATACSDKKNADALAQDSSLSRDLALANKDTTSQPQLKDVPATTSPAPAPVRREPAPRPKPAPAPKPKPAPTPAPKPVTTPSGNTVVTRPNTEGRVGVISAGSSLGLLAGQKVCTNTNSVGDRFTATVANAVSGSNGVVIPAGATAVVEVTSLKTSDQAGDNMTIGLAVRSVSFNGKTYPIDGQIASAQVEKADIGGSNDAAKVIGGAAVGAILGRVLGGRNKTAGTVIGAAAGGAGGAVLARSQHKYAACIPSGGKITVSLNQPMSIQGAPSQQQSAPSGNNNSI